MADQIENTIAENDKKASSVLQIKVQTYQKYVPHDDVVEQGLNDVQPREDFSELAQQIAKYHIAKMYEGKFQNVVSEFENVLEQAERETKEKFSNKNTERQQSDKETKNKFSTQSRERRI